MKLEQELSIAINAAMSAGHRLKESKQRADGIRWKEDGSPQCLLDRESSMVITASLMNAFPEYGILDEELGDQRSSATPSFVVDPLDGTVEYIEGGKNYGILIGLVKDGKSVLGVAYRPERDELTYAVRGCGAWIRTTEGDQRIHVNPSTDRHILVTSRRPDAKLERILAKLAPARIEPMASSFKTIDVATGYATMFISSPGTTMNLWDLCAPDVILPEAGGRITDLSGNGITYGKSLEHKTGILATNSTLHDDTLKEISSYTR